MKKPRKPGKGPKALDSNGSPFVCDDYLLGRKVHSVYIPKSQYSTSAIYLHEDIRALAAWLEKAAAWIESQEGK